MISMKISPRRVEKHLFFSTLLAGTKIMSKIVVYIPKLFIFLKLKIISARKMINLNFERYFIIKDNDK